MTNTVSTEEWTRRVIASIDAPQSSPHGDPLPHFPDATLQANTTGLSGEAAVRQAAGFHDDVVGAMARAGAPLRPGMQVLDFGCGWGRISRMFLREVSANDLHGIDVDPDFIALCKQLFGSERFSTCAPMPDGALPAQGFDLVVAYSVFSHLSQAAATAWLDEFHRILKPGGFVGFTTRHESFFAYLEWARNTPGVQGYTKALGELFDDTAVPMAALRRGEFVHATAMGVSGGGVRNESFYGESWIPQAWLEREYGDRFEVVAACFDPTKYDQIGFVLRKR
ncbi:Methyltransferase type 12 [Lysobacter dokdonensis DS-58]|uniref:Methyltransferase type 12 n=1 Tax=Lysobacter dokdonensis DS-58 TaxID=1300345 RepID=A0A0A2WLV8_9GAMM|nr:class I SAM-dependent methyltransferase [Lysobacter dokdonensis]KGQ20803.1 Methyltransferase type 12 [Lysobacter dokdonensis DS-58]